MNIKKIQSNKGATTKGEKSNHWEDQCSCKKTQSFLVETAVSNHQLDPNQCYIVGDSGPNDMLLAQNAQIKSVLVLTGDGVRSLTTGRGDWQETVPTHLAENCLDAVEKIIAYN